MPQPENRDVEIPLVCLQIKAKFILSMEKAFLVRVLVVEIPAE